MDEPIKDSDKIIITSVTGETRDQLELLKCYFQEYDRPGSYRLYNQEGEHIQTAPAVLHDTTKTFQFITGGALWTVDGFKIDSLLPISTADGHWVNDKDAANDEGEFHAQSGGGGAEESSYATA